MKNLILGLSILGLFLSSCDKEKESPQKYRVTVTTDGNGVATADPASAKAGDEVTITATPNSNYRFVTWRVTGGDVVIADAASTHATFIMPGEAVSVKAEFEEIRFKVGDYYPDPENAATAEGVVFWLDPSHTVGEGNDAAATHVKILNLDEGMCSWGPLETGTGANSKEDGRVNMTVIKNIVSDYSGYPAFEFCADKGDGWYLPAMNELQYIYCVYARIAPQTWDSVTLPVAEEVSGMPDINSIIADAGGVILQYGYQVSSSEYNISYHRALVFTSGRGSTAGQERNYKTNNGPVRCIKIIEPVAD